MEHAPWRIIIIAAGASLILLIGVFVFTLPKKATFETEPVEKILEFKSAFIAGHEEGRKVWEFYAKEGWSGKNKEFTLLSGVSKGRMYNKKDGDLIVRDLKALRVKAFRYSKITEAFGLPEGETKGQSKLTAFIAFTGKNPKTKKRQFAALVTDYLRYDPKAKKSNLSGHIRLQSSKLTLNCEVLEIDHEAEIARLNQNLTIKRKDLTCKGKYLEYSSKEEKINIEGSVEAKIQSSPHPTRLKATQVVFFADEKKDFTAVGSIEVQQGKKYSLAQRAVYNQPAKKLLLQGGVRTVIEKARAILKEETVAKLKSKDAKELLREKTFLTSDSLELKTKSGDAVARGRVTVSQKGREGRADLAVYSEKNETITLTGKVYLKKENQWIRCQKIIISVKNETFEAAGEVEAEFKIKK